MNSARGHAPDKWPLPTHADTACVVAAHRFNHTTSRQWHCYINGSQLFCILSGLTIAAACSVSPLLLPHVGSSLVEMRFAELAEVMLACAGVTLGRRFGRRCLKFCKRPFVVLDLPWLAFRVGPSAASLLDSYPATWLWNPRNGRVPKQSWIACPANDAGTLTEFTLSAYDWVRKRPVTHALASGVAGGLVASCNDSAISPSHDKHVGALWK